MAFASSADGDAEPVRVIAGQATLLSRTSHYISVDPVHDEIVTTNPFAEAILFFRGGADGEEPPIRVIQGPKTMLTGPDNVSVDPIHNELFVALRGKANAILVFDREASGDVAPKRILRGPKTRMTQPQRAEPDPINNLLVVSNRAEPTKGILIFNRTDSGDVAPKAIISGPKTGMNGVKRLVVYPEGKKIFALVKSAIALNPEREGVNFIGVWNYSDNGDVPPYAMLSASATTKLETPGGIGLNPEAKEIIVDGGGSPAALLVYHLPEVF